jgi:hypothetical protein
MVYIFSPINRIRKGSFPACIRCCTQAKEHQSINSLNDQKRAFPVNGSITSIVYPRSYNAAYLHSLGDDHLQNTERQSQSLVRSAGFRYTQLMLRPAVYWPSAVSKLRQTSEPCLLRDHRLQLLSSSQAAK